MTEENKDGDFQCRVCLEVGPRRAVIAPCRCAGSIQWVHRQCLEYERTQSYQSSTRCGICLTPYRFANVLVRANYGLAKYCEVLGISLLYLLGLLVLLLVYAGVFYVEDRLNHAPRQPFYIYCLQTCVLLFSILGLSTFFPRHSDDGQVSPASERRFIAGIVGFIVVLCFYPDATMVVFTIVCGSVGVVKGTYLAFAGVQEVARRTFGEDEYVSQVIDLARSCRPQGRPTTSATVTPIATYSRRSPDHSTGLDDYGDVSTRDLERGVALVAPTPSAARAPAVTERSGLLAK